MLDRRRRPSPAAYSDTVHERARVRREPEYNARDVESVAGAGPRW